MSQSTQELIREGIAMLGKFSAYERAKRTNLLMNQNMDIGPYDKTDASLNELIGIGFVEKDITKDDPILKLTKKGAYAMLLVKAMYVFENKNVPETSTELPLEFVVQVMDEHEVNEEAMIANKKFIAVYEKLLKEKGLI